ncbi:hypothetical protein [Rhodovulum sp. MB263]|uniref:hypothetical protein n=1 Tax=Rhodovulum sp. (strain MB263) TaxID=308754 RepID=UPI0018C8BE58|nr:hypothetical protein [Rhodovulum sp. MB263]
MSAGKASFGIETLTGGASGMAGEGWPESELSGSLRRDLRMPTMRPAAGEGIRSVLGNDPPRVSIILAAHAGQTDPGPVMFAYPGRQWRDVAGGHFEEGPQDISPMSVHFDSDGMPAEVVRVDEFPEGGPPRIIGTDPDGFRAQRV